MSIRRFVLAACCGVMLAPGAIALAGTEVDSSILEPDSATKAPTEAGFLQRWLVLEPIPHNNLKQSAVRAAVEKEHFPGQLTDIPKDGDVVKTEQGELKWHAVDTKLHNVNLYHLAHARDKATSNVLFWVVTIVDVPEEMKDVRLAIGSNAASVWWVNGKEVIGIYDDRQSVVDDGVSPRLTLPKGPTVIRAAVINGGGATDFCARLLDSNDEPITSVKVDLNAKVSDDK